MDAATLGTTRGPTRQPQPLIGAGLEGRDRRDVSFGRSVFQVLVQKRTENMSPEIQRRIAIEPHRPQCATVSNLLPVEPRSEYQEYLAVVLIFRLDRLVYC